MNTRRDALRLVAISSAAFSALGATQETTEKEDQPGHIHGTGTGEPGFKFNNEIDGVHQFDKAGVVAMANSGPDTNGCQFFITFAPAEHLNGNYKIFGEVVSG